jgi:hypothetical protein
MGAILSQTPFESAHCADDAASSVAPRSLIDDKTRDRVRYINKDARSIALVFVVPVCIPIFGILSTGWIGIRLVQWYLINARFKTEFQQILSPQSSNHVAGDFDLVNKFRQSLRLLWIGFVFWPAIVAGLLLILRVVG